MKTKKHPFEAKHVIVAGCAAIAMVMGAMSVGASFSTSNDRTATKAEVSSIVDSKSANNTQSSKVSGTGMSRQHTVEVRNFLQQGTPLYSTPAPNNKTLRNSLSPIFGTTDPVRFMDQIVQMQQQQAQATDSAAKASDSTKDASQPTTPTDGATATDNGTAPTDSTTPTDGSGKPADTTPPADGDGTSSQSLLMSDSDSVQ